MVPHQRENLNRGPFWLCVIGAVTAATLLIAVFSLVRGITEIYPYLFFLPLVLIAYFYPRWGVPSSLLLGMSLILLNWIFMRGDLLALSHSLLVAAVFIGIGGLVSILSENISRLHRRYLHIFDMSEAGILVVGQREGLVMESNPGVETQLGYAPEDLRTRPFQDIWKDPASCHAFCGDIEKEGHVTNRHQEMITRGGEMRHVLISGRHFLGSSYLVTLADIHNQVTAQEMLQRNEARYRQLVETAQEGIWVFDREFVTLLTNEKMAGMLGYSVKELDERCISDLVHPGDRETLSGMVKDIGTSGGGQREIRFIDRAGKQITAHTSYSAFSSGDGQRDGMLLLVTDITKKKEYEQNLRRSLHEKEILLKEIHHRVKNNMQVISSFLELSALQSGDDRVRAQFRETQGRVRAMALVHEKLYRSQWDGSVSAREFFHDLAREILSSSALQIVPKVHVEAGEVPLEIDHAIPCGLIVNELFTNSLKYAFTGRSHGTIRISFGEEAPGRYTLMFGDDGVGLPEGFSWEHSGTLGMRLVRFLSLQLDGVMEVQTGGGTRFVLTFPLTKST